MTRKEGSGRHSIVDPDALLKTVEANPKTSTRKLSAELGPSKTTIGRHLKKLGKFTRRSREVPHVLSLAQS